MELLIADVNGKITPKEVKAESYNKNNGKKA